MQHILLIGFKHVGKSAIGKQLAEMSSQSYCDLDEAIEQRYGQMTGNNSSCREIMRQHGTEYFRALEHQALESVLAADSSMVISLGGGTPLKPENLQLMRGHIIVHVTADKSKVYERIMVNGRPAFFPLEKNSYLAFNDLWIERDAIYRKLSHLTIDNSKSLDQTVSTLQSLLMT